MIEGRGVFSLLRSIDNLCVNRVNSYIRVRIGRAEAFILISMFGILAGIFCGENIFSMSDLSNDP